MEPARILVVDDDVAISMTVARVLRDYDVRTTNSCTNALRLIVEGAVFELILCDVMMPVMTGIELYEELVESFPAQAERMIFLTGGVVTDDAQEFFDRVAPPSLLKPFGPAEVLEAVERWLHTTRNRSPRDGG